MKDKMKAVIDTLWSEEETGIFSVMSFRTDSLRRTCSYYSHNGYNTNTKTVLKQSVKLCYSIRPHFLFRNAAIPECIVTTKQTNKNGSENEGKC